MKACHIFGLGRSRGPEALEMFLKMVWYQLVKILSAYACGGGCAGVGVCMHEGRWCLKDL